MGLPATGLIRHRLITPTPERLGYIRFAFEKGYTVEQVHELTWVDPWFLRQIECVIQEEAGFQGRKLEDITKAEFVKAKRDGLSDSFLARAVVTEPANT